MVVRNRLNHGKLKIIFPEIPFVELIKAVWNPLGFNCATLPSVSATLPALWCKSGCDQFKVVMLGAVAE